MTLANDIDLGRVLFEKAEQSTDPEQKSKLLLEAIKQLDYCAEEDISPAEQTLIANLRVSHTRRLLAQLVTDNSIQMDAWVGYLAIFLNFLKGEVDVLVQEDADFAEDYARFKQIWRREFLVAHGKE